MADLVSIVLAAGQGKRMVSRTSKMLHPIAGRPLVHFPVRAALGAGAGRVVVVASPGNRDALVDYLGKEFGSERVSVAVQDPPRGTGDAARVGLEAAGGTAGHILILCGDTPLVESEDLEPLVAAVREGRSALAALSCVVADPAGYGRIMRDAERRFVAIVEDRDLEGDAQRAISEINAGMYAVRGDVLEEALGELSPANAQGEYYLTDIVATANRRGGAVAIVGNQRALVGVNDRLQLVAAETALFVRIAEKHALRGVTIRGDARIEDSVVLEADVEIHPGVSLRGSTRVGTGTSIDVGCVISNTTIGKDARIKPYTVVEDSVVGDRADIGPFARLRPGSQIDEEAHVGNFVETKKTRLRKGAKANHLSYLGDGDIGERANVGAGTIFCNYDGFSKHLTVIGDDVFVGSDSQLVAPVTIGRGAYVGTGTTVTTDVPDEALAISRTRQENKLGYAPKLRARLKNRSKKT